MTASSDRLPDDQSSQLALAEHLADSADDDPDAVTRDEMAQIVALLSVDDGDVRVAAAEALQHLSDRPSLFEPFVGDLIAASASHPDDVEGIPAPIEWMSSAELRATIYVADSLARVARDRPECIVPHATQLLDALRSDENVPRYHLFSLAYAEAEDPGTVPRAWLRDELCDLLDRGRGNGYPSWAADALRRLGDSDALPALRDAYPDDSADQATREAFDDAIAALGTGEHDATRTEPPSAETGDSE